MFLYFFDEAINHAVEWAVNEFIPETDFEDTKATATTTSSSGPCPTGSNKPACEDTDCKGDDGVATCTAAGSKSKCPCAPLVTPFINSVDVGWLLGQAAILSTMHTTDGGNGGGAKPTCMADGAPWLDPTSFCDCGPSATYSTLSSTSGATSANCAYTSLPTNKITPTSRAGVVAPTNVPGQNGVPGCAAVIYPDGQACVNANYCNCGGTPAPFLTTTISGTKTTNCDYTIQPTASSCPPPTTTNAQPSATPCCAHIGINCVCSDKTVSQPDEDNRCCIGGTCTGDDAPACPAASSYWISVAARPTPTLQCNPTNAADYKAFSRDKAADAINSLCQKYHDGKLVLSQGGLSLPGSQYDDPEQISGASADGSTLVMNPVWSVQGCENALNPTNLDFGAMSVADCAGYFLHTMDGCPNFSNSNGDEYWKYGGTLADGCGLWTVRAQ